MIRILFVLFFFLTASPQIYAKSGKDLSFDFNFSYGSRQGFQPIFRDIPLHIFQEFKRREANNTLGPRAPLREDFARLPQDRTHWLMNTGAFPLPNGLPGHGFLLQGNNHSDDMDMFLVRRFGQSEGIRPGMQYELRVAVDLAGDAPIGAFGVGGDPELIVRALLTTTDPTYYLVDQDNHVRHPDLRLGPMQERAVNTNGVCMLEEPLDGEPMRGPLCPSGRIPFTLKQGALSPPMRIQADAKGQFWLMIGTHSGFESLSAIYYTRIRIEAREVIGR